jgi:hypothetical protein
MKQRHIESQIYAGRQHEDAKKSTIQDMIQLSHTRLQGYRTGINTILTHTLS